MMNIRKLREQLRLGKSIYDLPLRVTYYARVSTDKIEQQGSLENQIQYYTDFIHKNPNWTFVPGYVDEGISGTTALKRDSFLRMITDAHRGLFDFIITKEISRFSRSTLDSIQYTQELLDCSVGVLFQNDNINTLDTDSEFRLVVMAGVAQDEVRKLSERLKFGFHQSIKNGRVLGNDKLYGYDKKDCQLSINPEEAELIRLVFELYATGDYGTRKLAQEITKRGYNSRLGNDFNSVTVSHILQNPKYKGWYCGNKTQSLDYRVRKTAFLNEDEWIMYPDPNIPAIVAEELWDKANALFKARSARAKAHGVGYQSRYSYSGKIICGKDGTSFHRQTFDTQSGQVEYWRCKTYRVKGKTGCGLPSVRTTEINKILANLFQQIITHQDEIIHLVLQSISDSERNIDYTPQLNQLEDQMTQLEQKKDKLLDLSIAEAISIEEFKKRNSRFNEQIETLQEQIVQIKQKILQSQNTRVDHDALSKILWEELRFQNGISSEVVSTILDHLVVCENSTNNQIFLEIFLRLGQKASVHYSRDPFVFLTTSFS